MDRWLGTFFIGAILALFMPLVPDLFFVYLFFFFALLCLFSNKLRKTSGLLFGAGWIVFCSVQFNQSWTNNGVELPALFQSKQLVHGMVKNIPAITYSNSKTYESDVNKHSNYKFNFEISHLNHKKLSSPLVIRLNWRNPSVTVKQGNVLTLLVKIKPPHGLGNTGGFNYQVWLRQNNIIATGYVSKNKVNQRVDDSVTYRQKLYSTSLDILPTHRLSSLLTALSFGERSAIPQSSWDVLSKTNTQHLIAISGLHLGLIATASFVVFNFLFRLFPLKFLFPIKENNTPSNNAKYVLRLLSKNCRFFAIICSCSLTFYYAYLAGFSLPTVRALIMLLLFWAFKLTGINYRLSTLLLLTIFAVVILMPMSLISGSFWLSFYAVSLILLTQWRFKQGFAAKNGTVYWVKSLLWIQISLTVFMLPVSMLFNYQLSFVSLFANILAVPWMSVTSIPLCLLSVILLPISESASTLLYQLALMSTDILWQWLCFLAEQSWGVINLSFYQVVLFSLLVVLIAIQSFVPNKGKLLAFVFVICLSTLFIKYQQGREYWTVSVLDVGQGLSVVIEKNNSAIVYDTGANYPSGFNMAEASILPYLKHQGITALDTLIISHSDNDHAGGTSILKDALPIKNIIANDPSLQGNSQCKKGDSFIWQALTFSILWPLDSSQYLGDENDDSCVVHITDGDNSVLLTGDISKKIEKILLSNTTGSKRLNADIIVAPHHGSKTSSSKDFINAVAPSYVVFSTGFMNRWNMPAKEVKQRYFDQNVSAFNTAEDGMIQFRLKPNEYDTSQAISNHRSIRVIPYKQKTNPFWFAQ